MEASPDRPCACTAPAVPGCGGAGPRRAGLRPFLASSGAGSAADTKQYLYLDPGRLWSGRASLWDSHTGGHGAPPEHRLPVPDGALVLGVRAARGPRLGRQRLWLGTISFVAVLGARWLFRLLGVGRRGARGALVYMLTPYQLAFTARISVLLLPWAALPWLVGLTMRAVRRGGWRDRPSSPSSSWPPGASTSPPSSWPRGPPLARLRAVPGRAAARAALAAGGAHRRSQPRRVAVVDRGPAPPGRRTACPVLQLTENLRTLARPPRPTTSCGGLGNWFFYGRAVSATRSTRRGYDRRHAWWTSDLRHPGGGGRRSAGSCAGATAPTSPLLVVVGTVVARRAWPVRRPQPLRRGLEAVRPTIVRSGSRCATPPRSCRSWSWAWPGCSPPAWRRLRGARSGVGRRRAVGVASPASCRCGGTATLPRPSPPEDVPSTGARPSAASTSGGDDTGSSRSPGANFAAYRWGNTIEPITPG